MAAETQPVTVTELNTTNVSANQGHEELSTHAVDHKALRKRPSKLVRTVEDDNKDKDKDEDTVMATMTTLTESQYEFYRLKAEPFFLAGLEMSFYIANYQFMALITMLTGVWGFSLPTAVIITNVQEATEALLVIIFAWLGDTYFGDCMLVLYSAYIYSIGMALWYFMYPTYVGSLFYLGLVLITAGKSDYKKFTNNENVEDNKIVNDQKVDNSKQEKERDAEKDENNQEQEEESTHMKTRDKKGRLISSSFIMRIETSKTIRRSFKKFVTRRSTWVNIIGFVLSTYFWDPESSGLLPPICILLAYCVIFFAGKLFFYPFATPEENGSPLSPIFRISLMSFKNQLCEMWVHLRGNPSNSDEENPEQEKSILTPDEPGYNATTLSNNDPSIENDIRDTKCFVASIYLSLWFLMYGVMTAVANTFIVEQADKMDANIWLPIQWFVLSSEGVQQLVSYLCNKMWGKEVEGPHKRLFCTGTQRVGLGMLLSILYFAIASIVEAKRLKGKMCVLWLTPLLIILGVMDGLAMNGVECFIKQEMPAKVAKLYGGILAEGIIGIGKLLSILWFCFWLSVTDWFGKDINKSHLDYYYNRVMVEFSCICVIAYYAWVVYTYYRR